MHRRERFQAEAIYEPAREVLCPLNLFLVFRAQPGIESASSTAPRTRFSGAIFFCAAAKGRNETAFFRMQGKAKTLRLLPEVPVDEYYLQ